MRKKIINIYILKLILILLTLTIMLTSCNSIDYNEELLDLAGIKLQIEEFAVKEISEDKSTAIIYLDDKQSYAYIFMDSISSDDSIDEYFTLEEMVRNNPEEATNNVIAFFSMDETLIDVKALKSTKGIQFKNKLFFKTILTMNSTETGGKLKCDFYETVVEGRHTIFSLFSTSNNYKSNKNKFERMLETIEIKEEYEVFN